MVPLSCLFGYGTTLDAMTQGKGCYRSAFDQYAPVPLDDGGDDTFPQAMALRA
jgi:translation elongation factor EF-G